jgi:hypothetical protein
MALSKTETAILANAARRDTGNLLPLPRFIFVRGLSVVIALEKMIRRGLVEERQAAAGEPVWRIGRVPVTLTISPAGLAALHDAPVERIEPPFAAADPERVERPIATLSEDDRQAVLMSIMARPHGADVKRIQAETGLPLQSVRAAIIGLRAEGYMFDHAREPSGTITYHLLGWLPGDAGLEHAQAARLHA